MDMDGAAALRRAFTASGLVAFQMSNYGTAFPLTEESTHHVELPLVQTGERTGWTAPTAVEPAYARIEAGSAVHLTGRRHGPGSRGGSGRRSRTNRQPRTQQQPVERRTARTPRRAVVTTAPVTAPQTEEVA